MSVYDITSEIMSLNDDELNTVVEAVKYRRYQLTRQASRSLKRGDVVEFKNRQGAIVQGIVTKINQKTCIVKANRGHTEWRVTSSLLTRVTETS